MMISKVSISSICKPNGKHKSAKRQVKQDVLGGQGVITNNSLLLVEFRLGWFQAIKQSKHE